jgi:ribosome maturation factor RimP
VSGTAERLWEVIEPYVAREGIELDDIEVVGRGKGAIVRITIDADVPVDIDRIARISRGVSRILDDEDPVTSSYTLEVTSPGLERKLRRPRHYAKSVGREAKVKTRAPIDGERVHRGVITLAAAEDFTIDTNDGPRTIPYGEVISARTIFVWGATEPGRTG